LDSVSTGASDAELLDGWIREEDDFIRIAEEDVEDVSAGVDRVEILDGWLQTDDDLTGIAQNLDDEV